MIKETNTNSLLEVRTTIEANPLARISINLLLGLHLRELRPDYSKPLVHMPTSSSQIKLPSDFPQQDQAEFQFPEKSMSLAGGLLYKLYRIWSIKSKMKRKGRLYALF